MEKKKSYPPINALVRGLNLLSDINRLGVATVGKLHECSGVSKSTIVRNLETFEHAGFVARDTKGDGYVVTAKVLTLSSGYNISQRLVQLAAPILDDFRAIMPWPNDLAVFDGDGMIIIETSRNPGPLALIRPVGTRLPVTKSALGRAYLSNISADQCRAILDKNFDPTETDLKDRLNFEAELGVYKKQGYAINDQSLSTHTRGVAVPIFEQENTVACINTIVLSEAMSMDEVIGRCVTPLQKVARKIEALLEADRSK